MRQVLRRDQYGIEAVDEMVSFLTENKALLCVIAAGYQEEMQTCFLGTNLGLRRRFPNQWILQKYTRADILDLFTQILTDRDAIGEKMVFTKIRRVFSVEFTALDATARVSTLLFALDYLNALPNQAADVEKIAEAMYNLFSIKAPETISEQDYMTVINTFLKEQNDLMYVADFRYNAGEVDVIGADGTRTKLRM